MLKIKNRSSAKKRFRFTSNKKVKITQSNKKHNMLKRSKRQIRNQKGFSIMNSIKRKKITSYIPYL